MSIEERLAAVEARLRVAEDTLEIQRHINAYGFLADSGSSQAAAELWTEDGAYDVGGFRGGPGHRNVGHQNIKAIYDSPAHQELIHIGSAHFTGPLSITVHGDTAEAVGYSVVIKKGDDDWFLWRAAVNHWNLVRGADGWRIKERHNRVLDGSKASHDTMRKVMR